MLKGTRLMLAMLVAMLRLAVLLTLMLTAMQSRRVRQGRMAEEREAVAVA